MHCVFCAFASWLLIIIFFFLSNTSSFFFFWRTFFFLIRTCLHFGETHMLCRLRCCLNARRPTRAFWFLPFGNVYLRFYRRLLAAPFFFFRGVVRLLRCSQEDCPCLWFFCICYSSVLFQCNHKEKKVPSFYNCLNKRRTKINYHVESEGDRSLFFFIYLLVQSQQHWYWRESVSKRREVVLLLDMRGVGMERAKNLC